MVVYLKVRSVEESMPSAALLRPRSSRLTPSSVLFMSLLLIAASISQLVRHPVELAEAVQEVFSY